MLFLFYKIVSCGNFSTLDLILSKILKTSFLDKPSGKPVTGSIRNE